MNSHWAINETWNNALRRALFLPVQATKLAEQIDGLHYFVILTTFAGALFVTVVGGLFLLRYRRRASDAQSPPREDPARRMPPVIEWTLIGGLFGLFLFWWLVGFHLYVRLRVAPPGAMRIYVTGKQWMWKFAYPEGAHSISVLYVPVGRPVELILTSRDVIHSFYVAAFRDKEDAVPGRFTTMWFNVRKPGTYQVLCSEYCGVGHSTMRGEVVALAPADFDRWLAGHAPDSAIAGPVYHIPQVVGHAAPQEGVSLTRMGTEVAAQYGCLRCHSLDGRPQLGPTWAGLYGSKVSFEGGGEAVADDGYLTESMMDPMAKIVAGFRPIMPTYLGILKPAETAALLELIHSLEETPPQPARETPKP